MEEDISMSKFKVGDKVYLKDGFLPLFNGANPLNVIGIIISIKDKNNILPIKVEWKNGYTNIYNEKYLYHANKWEKITV